MRSMRGIGAAATILGLALGLATAIAASSAQAAAPPRALWTCDPLMGVACGAFLRGVGWAGGGGAWAVGDAGTIVQLSDGVWRRVGSPTVEALHAVAPVGDEVWVVGEGGTILHGHGAWRAVPSPTTATLYDLAMTGSGTGWAVGTRCRPECAAVVLAARDGYWSEALELPDAQLQAIDLRAADDGWAVGHGSTVLRYVDGAWTRLEGPPGDMALTDVDAVGPGEAWVSARQGPNLWHYTAGAWQAVDSPMPTDLHAVVVMPDGTGWAIGAGGIILRRQSGTWSVAPSPTQTLLLDVAVAPDGAALIAGGAGIVARRDDRWRVVEGVSGGAGLLLGVAVTGPTDAWAVGFGGLILQQRRGAWSTVRAPTTESLEDVAMVGTDDGWIVGASGTALRYRSGAWVAVSVPTTRGLTAVAMAGPDAGWAVGAGGTVLQWRDGRWSAAVAPVDARVGLSDVAVAAPGEAWAVGSGGVALRLQHGTWSRADAPAEVSLAAIALTGPDEGWAIGQGSDGRGRMLRLAGGRWQLQPSDYPVMADIAVTEDGQGWAVGDGMLAYRAGRWQVRSAPAGTPLRSVALWDADRGWAVGSGALLRLDLRHLWLPAAP